VDPEPLVAAADVPLAGGVILRDRNLVVTQPVEGEFRVFGAVCPHRECVVRSIVAGTINCLCHGSRFRITDGSVAGGPAPSGLPEHDAVVVDGMVTLET
jgi:nitrite reductase/ring-hydroxylating ferredoxin subunit